MIGLSHTGHLYDDNIRHRWEPSDVYAQINDKVKFIENYFMSTENDMKNNGNEPREIFFVGHSFGCYCILEILSMLNKEVKGQVKQAFLMFPMVERMLETPSGKNLSVLTKYLMWLVFLAAYLITFLPRFVRAFLVKKLWANRLPDLHNDLGFTFDYELSTYSLRGFICHKVGSILKVRTIGTFSKFHQKVLFLVRFI